MHRHQRSATISVRSVSTISPTLWIIALPGNAKVTGKGPRSAIIAPAVKLRFPIFSEETVADFGEHCSCYRQTKFARHHFVFCLACVKKKIYRAVQSRQPYHQPSASFGKMILQNEGEAATSSIAQISDIENGKSRGQFL